MKLFVIGATGYIGSVVAERLQGEGHVLTGLARSEDSAAQLRAAGIEPVRGALGDIDVITEQSAAADGVVQLSGGGFLTQALETVHEAVATTDAVLDALAGTDKPYVFNGGTGIWLDTGIMVPDRVVTEDDPISPPYFYSHFGDIQRKLTTVENVRTILVSPGQVYGRGGGYIGPIGRMFARVRKHGVVHAVENDNASTFVHVDDLADLYALVLRTPDVRGLYIAATDTVSAMDVARAVSAAAGLGGELELVDYATMRRLNGRAGELDFWSNCRASGDKARKELGWRPERPGVIADLAALPKPLDLDTVYPEPRRQAAAARISF
ncbi:NAD-dependent epimerase/dehydratase family protein [Streptomyces sp. NPDC001002]